SATAFGNIINNLPPLTNYQFSVLILPLKNWHPISGDDGYLVLEFSRRNRADCWSLGASLNGAEFRLVRKERKGSHRQGKSIGIRKSVYRSGSLADDVA